MYPFTLAMQMLAYFISSVAPTLKASNTVSYGIMLFAIVIESFVSDNMLLTFLFTEDASDIVVFLRYFFCCYPPFSYTKVKPKLCRSSRTSRNTRGFTSASHSAGGCPLTLLIPGENIRKTSKASCPSVAATTTGTQISNQPQSSSATASSSSSSPTTSTMWSPRIADAASLPTSRSTRYSAVYSASATNRKKDIWFETQTNRSTLLTLFNNRRNRLSRRGRKYSTTPKTAYLPSACASKTCAKRSALSSPATGCRPSRTSLWRLRQMS